MRIDCACGRGSYDADMYQSCWFCNTEGKQDCPSCGKQRSVEPDRFLVCYTCNQQSRSPKCTVCRYEGDGNAWQIFPDGRYLVVCDDCLAGVDGVLENLPIPQPTLFPANGRPLPLPTRRAPVIKGLATSITSPVVETSKTMDLESLAAKRKEVQEIKRKIQDKESVTPWHLPITKPEKLNERLPCQVCNQRFFFRIGHMGPKICVACQWDLQISLYCGCCREQSNVLFPQGRIEYDGESMVREWVCVGCLYGFHGTNCTVPSEFPCNLCVNDGNFIESGRPICDECWEKKLVELQFDK